MSVYLHPTGTCFEDCTLEFARRIRENKALMFDETFRLVHGICGPNEDVPKPYSHALGAPIPCALPGSQGGQMKTTKAYLGDGLYANSDGDIIELSADRCGGTHRVYLEPENLEELLRYAAKLWNLKITVESKPPCE